MRRRPQIAYSVLPIPYFVFRFIFAALLIASCATPQPPTSNFQLPAANPRPPTLKPTEDTPQPPTAVLAATAIPKEANGKIVAAAWDAGDEVLKEFKSQRWRRLACGCRIGNQVCASLVNIHHARWQNAPTIFFFARYSGAVHRHARI